ncbi:tetratricopeptide repeat protein [Hymenobacter sp. DG25A]|uniref:type IX secretion system periplasmic lipoprotein PorW/SprE n=1 Tax=Hymenobacter sp. DG25A TaxID=1385663 RepID=UPI0006BD6237|nr:tetratricopeptide repeat protein [Hymenobacter sp. DG25A]ALD21928.1 hypothetical protein AM218_12820 [Hymenobacter sp. DG25A]
MPLRLFSAPLALALLLACLQACSSGERTSVVGRTYQNIAARDNGYFLGREKIRATEASLYKTRNNDYNRILPLLPVVDSVTATRLAADMEDIIKKASIPIQHHAASDWTDDSYILIGKARYYKREFEDAAKTFKYVNTTSKDPNARHEALIWLMRTFLATKEYESAAAVSDILDKEKGTEVNARELFLTRAQYYLLTDNQPLAIENLEKAIPYIEPKDERSRTRYILAQLYQATGNDKQAYAQLNQILKRNPPYELDFYSKLMLGQVSDLNTTDKARLDKYFAKLLKDGKNAEYRDKIYYEMARLQYRQQHYPEAIALLEKSARAAGPNRAQKGYTYLLAGRIYYDNLQRYSLAAAYYDSTMQMLPREAQDYAALAERASILKEFANQLNIVTTQDSLQMLARLDNATLQTRLTAYAQAELTTRRQAEERLAAQQKRAEQSQTATGISDVRSGNPDIDPLAFAASNTGAQWYFDNPTAMSTARSEFVRRWGNRQLQDNWRISSQANTSPVTNQGDVPISIAGTDATVVNNTAAEADPAAQLTTLVAEYQKNIPVGPEQLAASNKQIEEALFALGAIYSQQLKEPDRAITTYETLLSRFPRSGHVPEVYYGLYLLYRDKQDPKAETYAQRLRQEYPTTSYARLVADPEYLRRMSVANSGVSVQLDSAFTFYKKQEFKKAGTVLARTRKKYPESDYSDRLAYMDLLLALRTQAPATTKPQVERFLKTYPNSPLAPDAKELLATFTRYEQGQLPGALASAQKPSLSYFRPGEVDNKLRIFNNDPAPVTPPPGVTPGSAKPPVPGTSAAPDAKAPATTATPSAKPVSTPDSTKATRAGVPPAAPAVPGQTPPAPATTATAPPVAPVSPYAAGTNGAHAVVLVVSKNSPLLKDLPGQLGTYNNRFYRASNLQVQPQSLNDSLSLIVVQPLAGAKVAQSYGLKLRGPQGPLGRLRGVGYQTLIVGIENIPVLLQRKDVEEYLRFYQQVYRP